MERGDIMNALQIAALASLAVTGILAVMMPDLLVAAIGLALASAILSIALFMMDMPWAAVLELSVCAGLITVVFVSAISLTKPMKKPEARAFARKKLLRFMWLPAMALAAFIYMMVSFDFGSAPFSRSSLGNMAADFRNIMWLARPMDMIGQMIMILVGIFGVVVLFKGLAPKKKDGDR
jgi:NADH-quinone oxidoreductase subunit J